MISCGQEIKVFIQPFHTLADIELIRSKYVKAGCDVRHVSYVSEIGNTGTMLICRKKKRSFHDEQWQKDFHASSSATNWNANWGYADGNKEQLYLRNPLK